MTNTAPRVRYRFAQFTVSPSTRLLLKGDVEVPLIPRYFDLLVLLIERRNEAVTRDEIFERVWNDVIVSDGALTQAIRILRRSLGDNAKEPRFIRTVSRHGYRFVGENVVEEVPPENAGSLEEARALLDKAKPPETEDDEAQLRNAAEIVLEAGPAEDLAQFNEVARALLRDARWDLPRAERAPLVGPPGPFAAVRVLITMRIRRAYRLVRRRWRGATVGGAAAGLVGGLMGALVLRYGPGSTATASVFFALPLVGGVVGALGALGVGGGLAWAEALVRSYRRTALVVLGACGGGLIGGLTHTIGRYTFESLFGRDLSPVGGGFEGFVIGAAVGLGYAVATPIASGGMATPRGWPRCRVALITGMVCASASAFLGLSGHHLGAMSLDFMSKSFPGSQVSLEPLARLLGEATPAAATRCTISAFEGFLFASGVAFGLTQRPRR